SNWFVVGGQCPPISWLVLQAIALLPAGIPCGAYGGKNNVSPHCTVWCTSVYFGWKCETFPRVAAHRSPRCTSPTAPHRVHPIECEPAGDCTGSPLFRQRATIGSRCCVHFPHPAATRKVLEAF